jgi:A/G-specific adenine glycosylase
LLGWFAVNARDLPWRRTRDPYAIWVSEIMLQQTQVKTVIPYFERWMRALPDIRALAGAPSETIHKLWEGLGYYTRVRNMQQAARDIIREHTGKFPDRFDDVLALPGIGRYTAGAICSIAFNQPAPILDGNVIRVLTRLMGIRENARERETNARLWTLAQELVSLAPSASRRDTRLGNCSALNQSLMELGAMVCTARQPRCGDCPVAVHCVARRRKLVDQLPNLGERIATTARYFAASVVERDGAVLVRQRPAGVVNGHLWEFPNVELPPKSSISTLRRQLEVELGCTVEALTPLATVKHSITRYRITLESFRVRLNGAAPRAGAGEWVLFDQLERLPFTSAHRKILAAVRRDAGGTL